MCWSDPVSAEPPPPPRTAEGEDLDPMHICETSQLPETGSGGPEWMELEARGRVRMER